MITLFRPNVEFKILSFHLGGDLLRSCWCFLALFSFFGAFAPCSSMVLAYWHMKFLNWEIDYADGLFSKISTLSYNCTTNAQLAECLHLQWPHWKAHRALVFIVVLHAAYQLLFNLSTPFRFLKCEFCWMNLNFMLTPRTITSYRIVHCVRFMSTNLFLLAMASTLVRPR